MDFILKLHITKLKALARLEIQKEKKSYKRNSRSKYLKSDSLRRNRYFDFWEENESLNLNSN